MKNIEQAIKDYNKNIKNAKKVKKILEKSWMRTDLLESVDFIIKNYRLDDEVKLKYWLYDFCSIHHINHVSGYDGIFSPVKIKTFSGPYLQMVKKWIENWNADERLTKRWTYDYSIHITWNKWWYSREYRWCWNWYYYLMLDHETALFYEKD
jgi:hypothetical protein